MNRIRYALFPLALAMLAACATTPPTSERLQSAREAVRAVETDPQVARFAPVAVSEARDALRLAEAAARGDADPAQVDHLALIAERRAQIAQANARREMVARSAEQMAAERQEIQLQARERALAQAQREAQESQRALEEARRRLAELEPTQTERGLTFTMSEVLFPFDSAELKPGSARTVDRLADFLRQQPDHNILVEGHTDSVGDASYNQRLSERRAESVREALVERGIAPERVRAMGLGENYPVASNSNNAGRSENRRVEIVVAQGEEPMSRAEQQRANLTRERRRDS